MTAPTSRRVGPAVDVVTDDERERLAAMCREAIDWRERWCAADTNGLVASARRMVAAGVAQVDIARVLGVGQATVSRRLREIG